MADFTLDANSFGAFHRNFGGNGTNDRITVNIGPNFRGTITVDALGADGEVEETTVNLPDGWRFEVTGMSETRDEAPGSKDWSGIVYDSNGDAVGTVSIRSNHIEIEGVPCLTRGTMIDTPSGPQAVETLQVGDAVLTRDNGPQVIRWTGTRKLGPRMLAAMPYLRPVRIRAAALGPGIPARDLLVSPQHRILIRSAIAARLFGAAEVLVAAKQLLELDGISIAEDVETAEYFHILFDRHQVITTNGAETESLYTGPEALKSLGPAARDEILTIFPELRDLGFVPDMARPCPSGRHARKLAARHIRNHKPLVA